MRWWFGSDRRWLGRGTGDIKLARSCRIRVNLILLGPSQMTREPNGYLFTGKKKYFNNES